MHNIHPLRDDVIHSEWKNPKRKQDESTHPGLLFCNLINQDTSPALFQERCKKISNYALNSTGKYGTTALHTAAEAGNIPLIQYIWKESGACHSTLLNSMDDRDTTPVYLATLLGVMNETERSLYNTTLEDGTAAVRYLIQLGADLNIGRLMCHYQRPKTPLDVVLDDPISNLPLVRLLVLNGGRVYNLLSPTAIARFKARRP